MKSIKFFTLLLLLIGGHFVQSQNIKFVKKYSFPGMNGGLGACKTSDGGIAITGQHESGHCSVYIAKINKCGSLQWYKIYDFGSSAGGLSITETYDGGLVIAGAADLTGSGYDWLVMKVDANGNYLWHDLWRNGPTLACGTEWAQSITELPNHNLAAAGGSYMWFNSGCEGLKNDGVVSFYAPNGTYLYTQKLAGPNYDMFHSITQNGNYIYIVGSTYSFGAGGRDIVVVKTDLYGNALWIKTFGTNRDEGYVNDSFHKGYPTSDGGLLIATRIYASSGDPLLASPDVVNTLLVKIDMNGNLQWAKTYGFGGWDDYAIGLTVSPSGKICVAGSTWGNQVKGGREAYVAVLNSNGIPIQTNGYGFPMDDSFIEALNYSGNRFLLVGNTNQSGTGFDPFIVVSDSLGQCQGCSNWFLNFQPYKDITSSIQTTNVSIINYWTNHSIVPYSHVPGVSNVNPTDDFVCASCSAIAPSFTVSRSNLCVGDSLNITNTTPANDACLEWFINGSPINPHRNDTTIAYNTPGTYTLSIQTTCGTTVLATSQTVHVWPQFSITASTNSVSCYGGTNGSATVNISGGMPPYSYLWNPSAQTGSVLTGVPMGPYTVTVNDAGACGSTYTSVNIPQPISPPGLNILQTHSITCLGANDGSVVVNGYGGTGTLSYSWIPGGMTSATVTNLSPAIYTVQVIDANNCIASKTINIQQPPAISITLNSGSVSCNGGNDGWLTGIATGGNGAFTYTWLPINSNNPNVSNLPVGQYTLAVKDLNNCFSSDTISIIQPLPLNTSVSSNSAICFGTSTGSATVSVTGGVGGYQYQWLPTGGTNSVAMGLAAGQYTIQVVDANNCSTSNTVNVIEPPALSLTLNSGSVSCFGGSDGWVSGTPSGGNGSYTYTWFPTNSNSSNVNNLPVGVYTLVVNDLNNCSITNTVSVIEPSPLNTYVIPSDVKCFGTATGSATITVTGGVGGYQYQWLPTGGTNSVASNLAVGQYTITVTDANNCTTTATVDIQQPPALSLTLNSGSVSCNGGSDGWVSGTASGGSGAYTYTWFPVNSNNSYVSNLPIGNYTLVVKDLNNCFWADTISITQPPALSITATSFSSACYGIPTGSGTVSVSGGVGGYQYQWLPIGGTNSVATNLPGGQYTISVLDANNCPISTTLMINQPSSITLVPTPNATICYGTSTIVGVNVSGGTPPYTYFWNDGLVGPGPHTVSPLSTNFYNVYVNDNNNCVSETKTIKITVLPPITVVNSSISVCDKDTTIIGMNAYGGNGGPYTYLWNTGSTSNTISVIADISQNPMTYTLNVSDGCTNPDGVGIFTVYVNPLPILSFVANPISGCVPLKVTFNAINGTSFDDYYWDFGNNQHGNINPVQVIYDVVDTFDVKLKMTTMFGCKKDTIVPNLITTYSVPIASFYPDPPVVSELNGEIHFINTSIGSTTYFWNFGDPYSTNNTDFSMNTVHLYSQPNTYTVSLVVTNSFGCSDTTQSIVTIRPDVAIYIPNTFTPNDDGINDVFKPVGVGIQGYNYKMEIFDRWGEKIFETTDFNEGWNGTYRGQKAKEGVYAYYIVLYDIKGYKHFYKGHVTLLSHQ